MSLGLRDSSPRPNARKGDKNAKTDKNAAKTDPIPPKRERRQSEDKPKASKERTEKPAVSYPVHKPAQSLLEGSVRTEIAEPITDRKGVLNWSVKISPSLVIMLIVLLLVTLSFFFVFGLVIGRGTVPPSQGPELDRLLPESEIASPLTPESILPAEDLHFMSNLRAEGEQDTPLLGPDETTGSGPTSQTGPPADEALSQVDASLQQLTRYDFVLQAAAFKVEAQADALRLRLEDVGMRTKLVRENAQSGTWYFVQVLYRGTEENLQVLRDSLTSFGIRDSILTSKTQVD